MSAITSAILDCADGWDPGFPLPVVCGACLIVHHPHLINGHTLVGFGEIDCAVEIYGEPGDQLPESEREKLRDFAQREVLLGSVCQ